MSRSALAALGMEVPRVMMDYPSVDLAEVRVRSELEPDMHFIENIAHVGYAGRLERSRGLESLIKAGAFDSLQLNRASLIASVDRAFDFANAAEAKRSSSLSFHFMTPLRKIE